MNSNIVVILFLSTLQLATLFSIINDYSLLKIMFGNITELKDLALPPMDEIKKYKVEEPQNSYTDDFRFDSKDIDKVFALIPVDPKERKYAYGVLEFNAITESLSQLVTNKTRRFLGGWDKWLENAVSDVINSAISIAVVGVTVVSIVVDGAVEYFTRRDPNYYYDSDYYRGREDSADYPAMEYQKLERLDKLLICLLIHTRYRVDHAIRQRKKSMHTKAYRLGYLFNRLRRIKYLQAKAVHTANIERIAIETIRPAFTSVKENYGFQVVRWYEKMIHLDVDLRDLCNLVRDTLEEKDARPNYNPRELQKMSSG